MKRELDAGMQFIAMHCTKLCSEHVGTARTSRDAVRPLDHVPCCLAMHRLSSLCTSRMARSSTSTAPRVCGARRPLPTWAAGTLAPPWRTWTCRCGRGSRAAQCGMALQAAWDTVCVALPASAGHCIHWPQFAGCGVQNACRPCHVARIKASTLLL